MPTQRRVGILMQNSPNAGCLEASETLHHDRRPVSLTLCVTDYLEYKWSHQVTAFVLLDAYSNTCFWCARNSTQLPQTSNEVYGFSKLRRFLAYVNFMTQDTLRFLVQASLDEFVRYASNVLSPRNVNYNNAAARFRDMCPWCTSQ